MSFFIENTVIISGGRRRKRQIYLRVIGLVFGLRVTVMIDFHT